MQCVTHRLTYTREKPAVSMKTPTLLEILYEINDGDYVYDGKRHIITTIITMKSMDKKR